MTQAARGPDSGAMWRQFSDEQPQVGESVLALTDRWLRLREDLGRVEFGEVLELGLPPLAADVMSDPETVPLGIFGVGTWLMREGPVPAIFVHRGIAPAAGVPLGLSPIGRLFADSGEVGAAPYVVPLDQPVRHNGWHAGDRLTVGSREGSVCVAATCRRSGERGFLTAGHVAPTRGALVRDEAGQRIGNVSRTLPTDWTTSDATPDVAFVMAGLYPPPAPTSSFRPVRAGEAIRMQSPRGTMSSFIRGLSPVFFVAPEEAPWGQVALTATAISINGDSGAPVYGADNSLVGMLVGGTSNDLSVIQDITYQLGEIETDLA